VRNLAASEIVNQVFAAQSITRSPITNIVLMGMGEPLSNYKAVTVQIDGSQRHGVFEQKVTASRAVLLPPSSEWRTIRNGCQFGGVIERHNDMRSRIMPVNRPVPDALLQSLDILQRDI
jgi:23S rRNA (adenine2503-C2)-methyltransferase